MRLRLRFDFPRRVLLAIAYRLGLRRPAKREEAVDFIESAFEDATEEALETYDRENER